MTLLQLKMFIDELCNREDLEADVYLSDRFNDYEIKENYKVEDDQIIIDCEKKGSILEGKHRVMGR